MDEVINDPSSDATCSENGMCGNATEATTCCRYYRFMLCDSDNALPHLRCVCDRVGGGNLRSSQIGTTPINTSVTYDINFRNMWTMDRHPPAFPSGDHWSLPIAASHSSDYVMWAPGMMATQGVQDVAERGRNFNLESELGAATDVLDFIDGRVSDTRTFSLEVDSEHPLISVIAMIAPSPDWFAGVHDIRPTTNGFWWDGFVIDVFPYDSGTDGGTTYRSGNVPLGESSLPIFRLTPDTAPETGEGRAFVKDDKVLPVATLTFTKIM